MYKYIYGVMRIYIFIYRHTYILFSSQSKQYVFYSNTIYIYMACDGKFPKKHCMFTSC